MKKRIGILMALSGLNIGLFAQEDQIVDVPQSAEVFLDAYTDTFQEFFFEGLLQKGIENYDKAINAFLECKRLAPDDQAIAHELAKSHFRDKQYPQAEQYALEAVNAEPGNFWFLQNLNAILKAQGRTMGMVQEQVPWNNTELREQLAQVYYQDKEYEAALQVLQELPVTGHLKRLKDRVNGALLKNTKTVVNSSGTIAIKPDTSDTLTDLQKRTDRIKALMRMGTTQGMLSQTKEAMERYPLQPFFYYAQGYALNEDKAFAKAADILEEGLGYVLDDPRLANDFYKELVRAYTGALQPAKAQQYKNKMNPGF